MTEAQSQAILVRAASERINQPLNFERLPNGILRIRTVWGWLYLEIDGTIHSRQYR